MANKADLATSTVLTAPSPATSGTSVVVQSGHGTRFPTAPFYVTAHPDGVAPTFDNAEILYVSAKSTDTFTITRAQKGTSAQSIATGWRISNAIYAGDIDNTSIVRNEVPGGSVNSSNTTFTTASVFASGSLRVYKNGLRLKGGGNDFTESATLNGFTTTTAPTTGDLLLVDYEVGSSVTQVGTNSFIAYETPSGSVNSSNTAFTTARAYIAGSLQVYIDGLFQRVTTDYTETTPGSGSFTMATAPATGQSIRVSYQYNLNSSSNADTVDGVHGSAYSGQAGQLIATTYGWEAINATLTYSSADSPTFVASTSIDLTGYVGVGDKIWITQTTSKYFIVTAITSTTITLYGGTDYTLANAAISAPYVSHSKSPFGFPLSPDKWTVETTSTSTGTQASPVSGTWYNLGTITISIPIGIWDVAYYCGISSQEASGTDAASHASTLSTANNSESNADMTAQSRLYTSTSETKQLWVTHHKSDVIVLAAKTTYYLNHKVLNTGLNDLTLTGDVSKILIRARCVYL